MQSTEKTSKWISTSFASTSETGGGDSVSSFQSEIIPESKVVDQEHKVVDFESNATKTESQAAVMGSKVVKMDSNAAVPQPNAADIDSNAALPEPNAADIDLQPNVVDMDSNVADLQPKSVDIKLNVPEADLNAAVVDANAAPAELNMVDGDSNAANLQPNVIDMDLNGPEVEPNSVDIGANAADIEPSVVDMDTNVTNVEKSVDMNPNTADVELSVDMNPNAADVKLNVDMSPNTADIVPNVDMNPNAADVEPSVIDMDTNAVDVESSVIDMDANAVDVEPSDIHMDTNIADIEPSAVDMDENDAGIEPNAVNIDSNVVNMHLNAACVKPNAADTDSNAAEIQPHPVDLESNAADLESNIADLESNAIDLQSAEQSFDISQQKSPALNESTLEKSKSENTSAINVFEEDARSSWSEEPKPREFKETAIDDCSQTSVSSRKSTSKKPSSDDEETKRDFPPENLFEYMWPQENGEFFILQEQICDYLNVKSFKRKYPDLFRRSVDMAEKQFLKEKGVVTEMQCDLGLTALRSEEVLELMSKDYPDHYKEYIKVLREKEQQSISEKHKEYVATNSDKNKMVDLVKKAVQSAAEYNAHLNQERREERKSCMDLQTFTIHYPVKSNKVKKTTKPGKYPVALLPGQFQDYYKEYTPDELKYLPVNTVLYGPLKELNSIKALSDGGQSDSDDSTASDGSCCSSSQGTQEDGSSGSEKPDMNKKPNMPGSPHQPKTKQNAVCKVCKTGAEGKMKEGKPEELVHCTDCENSAHPSCIELTADVVAVLKTYPWQCMDCKVCSQCREPNEEDKMLFCDTCDRGYHTFCVGLKSLPQGRWICRQCGTCSICGSNRPGPELSKAQWQYDFSKGNETDAKNRHPKLLCMSCSKKKR